MSKATERAAAAAEPIKVWLGNRAVVELVEDRAAADKMTAAEIATQGVPKIRRAVPVPKGATFFRIDAETPLLDGVQDVVKLWPQMSDAPVPAWIASTDPTFALVLSKHWQGVEIREPEDNDGADHGPYEVDEQAAAKLAKEA